MSQQILVGYHVYCMWSWLGSKENSEAALSKMEKGGGSADVSPLAQIMLHNVQSTHAWISGDGQRSMAAFTQARELAQAHGLFNLVTTLFSQGIVAAVLLKDYRRAIALLEEIRPFGEKSRGMHGVLYYHQLAWVTAVRGNYPIAYEHSKHTVELHISVGNFFVEALVRWTHCQIFVELCELEGAEEQLSCIRVIQRKLNSRIVDYMVAFLEAQLALAQNQQSQALPAIERALSISRETGLVFAMGCLPVCLVRICAVAIEHKIEVEQVRHIIKKVDLVPEEPLLMNDSWPWPVKIYTLGRFMLMSEVGAIQFGRKVPRGPLALLKLLIALGGQEVSQGQILEWLWPDSDGDAAYRSLKMTLSRLRKLLKHENAILFSGGTVSINSEVCWVDSLSFRHLARQLEREAKQGNFSKSFECAERANRLYKGEFLSQDDEAWVLPAREQIQRASLLLHEQLAKPYQSSKRLARKV